MCTFENDEKLKKPKAEKITVYKVFGEGKLTKTNIPETFANGKQFKFGANKWNQQIADGDCNLQSGFQVFVLKSHANKYATCFDLVCPITIRTKDITKMTNKFRGVLCGLSFRVYEVKAFTIWKKDWKAAKAKAKKEI